MHMGDGVLRLKKAGNQTQMYQHAHVSFAAIWSNRASMLSCLYPMRYGECAFDP